MADLGNRGYGHLFDIPGADEDDIIFGSHTSKVTLSTSIGKEVEVLSASKTTSNAGMVGGIDLKLADRQRCVALIEDNQPVVNYTSDFAVLYLKVSPTDKASGMERRKV